MNNIPENINRDHIIKAIEEIDKNRYPPKRKSTRYNLVYNGGNYPPKYTVSLANKYANGIELEYDEFYGGKEVNEFLESRGFTIIKFR
jgi:hypothetical protein